MKYNLPQLLVLLFCFLLPTCVLGQLFPPLGAQRAGISALTFLKMDISPRSAGLGGAGICLTGDGYSTQVNPASLAESKNFTLAASNTMWASGINYAFISGAKPTKFGHLGLSLGGLSSGAMEVRTEFQPDGTGEYFYANYTTAGLTYSRKLTDMFSYGFTLKYVREDLAGLTSQTGVVDMGFLYRTDFKDLSFSVLVQSFGVNSSLKGSFNIDSSFSSKTRNIESYPAPTVFKLGISIKPWQNATGDQSLTALVQLNHPNDNAENIRLGLEYDFKSLLFLRAGYKVNVKDQDYPTAGIGLRARIGRHPLRFDYAIDPLSQLGIIHRVGLVFTANPAKDGER